MRAWHPHFVSDRHKEIISNAKKNAEMVKLEYKNFFLKMSRSLGIVPRTDFSLKTSPGEGTVPVPENTS
jgi:hypothetical protein